MQMFLYVDLMIACRLSLEIKQCLKDLLSVVVSHRQFRSRDHLPSQSLPGPQSQMFTSPGILPKDQQNKAFVEETNHT